MSKKATQVELVQGILTGTAESLRLQAKAIDDAAAQLPAELPDEASDLVLKMMVTSTIGSLEVIKAMLLKSMLEDMQAEAEFKALRVKRGSATTQ